MKNESPERSMDEAVSVCTDHNIPSSRSQREDIIAAASKVAASGEMTVPVGLEDLLPRARQLLEDNGLDAGYIQYASVALSNELWRDIFASIPSRRRLLLLPQCLRNPESCPASVDQYGLVCDRCGRCDVGTLIDEAEKLGYVCLVTEGTAVVTSLIESGKVEAIIGVGCLESLEKVFPYMHAGGVPGLAVPLLRSGCSQTGIDMDYLIEFLYLSREDNGYAVNMERLSKEIDTWFSPESLSELFDGVSGAVERIAGEWMASGGKRWRPLLTVCAHESMRPSGDQLPEYLRIAAVAVECFHKASLIHDDIEDDDTERYGRDSIHVEYGVPVAINVGDYLVGEGYRLLANSDLPPECRAMMILAASDAHHRLCVGQGEELDLRDQSGLPSVDKLLEISRLKTAPAFEVALKLGVIAAGRGDKFDGVIEKFCGAVGVAYQLRDDVVDADDSHPGNMMQSLASEFPGENRDALETRVVAMIRHYKEVASVAIASADEPGLKILLHRIMAKIFSRSMECCGDSDESHDRRR